MATTAQRLAEYEELYKKAQGYDPNQFRNQFEKEYNEAVNYNKDLIEQQSGALGELQTVAPTLREKYMNTLISNPTAQMALIAQARQAPITQWSTASNLLNARGQRYQDILGKALGAYQTSANQANMAAENAWRLYQDALQQDQFNAQLRASRENQDRLNLLDLNGNGIPDIYETPEPPGPGEGVGGGFVEDDEGESNWTGSTQKLNVFNAIPTLIGNYLGNTRIKKPGRELTFMEKLLNRRSNRGSGSVGGSW